MAHKTYHNTHLTLFRNVKTTLKDGPPLAVTAGEHLEAIRAGTYSRGVSAVRAARGTANYRRLKEKLPAICWGAFLPDGRKETDVGELTGLIFLDWDQHDGAPNAELRDAQKARFAQLPGVQAVDPVPTNSWEYAQAWAYCVQAFQLRADRNNDPGVKNANRLAIVSADADAHINLDAVPLPWTGTVAAPAGAGPLLGGAAPPTHNPENAFDAFVLIARHYGSKGPDAEADPNGQTGIRLACPYHGSSNPTTLHLWAEPKSYHSKNAKQVQVIFIPHAECFTKCAKSQTLLRFLGLDSGVKSPLIPRDKALIVPAVATVLDVLDLLRLELRMTLPDGGVEVRAKHVNGAPLPGNAFNYGLDGWAPPEEWRALGKPLEAHIGCTIDTYFDLVGIEKRKEAVVSIAAANVVDPVREWLDTLPEWDGVERLERLVINALGAQPGPIAAAFGRSLVGAVARIRTHGAVHDWMPVQRQLLLPVPSIILAGSPPVPDCAAGPLRCGSWGRRIPG